MEATTTAVNPAGFSGMRGTVSLVRATASRLVPFLRTERPRAKSIPARHDYEELIATASNVNSAPDAIAEVYGALNRDFSMGIYEKQRLRLVSAIIENPQTPIKLLEQIKVEARLHLIFMLPPTARMANVDPFRRQRDILTIKAVNRRLEERVAPKEAIAAGF